MSIKEQNFTGMRFSRLVAISREDRILESGGTVCFWWFKCDCGEIKRQNIYDVLKGKIQSCGCFRSESLKKRIVHGCNREGKRERVYNIYNQMKSRCKNPSQINYDKYGGRGIKVCDRWLESFENFLEDMGRPQPHESLDRIDLDGDYSPENCKWATNAEQARNRSDNVWVWHEGIKYCLTDYARKVNKSLAAIDRRMRKYGETPEVAATKVQGPFKERSLFRKRKPKPK